MSDGTERLENEGGPPLPDTAPVADKTRTPRWVTAAGVGIGSAALVAALLYTTRGKVTKKPE